MPRKIFVAGEILTAADVNTNLMDQSVMVFDDATARATAIPTPVEGMVTYLKDTDAVEKFDGSDFVPVAIEPDPPAILQVVSTTKTDTFTTTSATFETVTGLTATITPSSSSSKILVTAFVNTSVTTDPRGAHIRLSGGNAGDFVGDAASNRVQAMGTTGAIAQGFYNINFGVASISGVLLDSPATTSAVTYGVEIRRGQGGTGFVNRSGADSDNSDFARLASSITVMEVAG